MEGGGLSVPVPLLLTASAALSEAPGKGPTVRPDQAAAHVGETVEVCGAEAGVHLAFRTRHQPAFIDFGRPHPHREFTAVIWGLDRGKFGDP